MNTRTLLATLFLLCSIATISYGAITLKTYNNGTTTNSLSTVVDEEDKAITIKQYDNGTSTNSIDRTVSPGTLFPVYMSQSETASPSAVVGNLYIWWDTSANQLKFRYKEADGETYVGSFTFDAEQ